MSNYLAYVVGKGGHFLDSAIIECSNDIGAARIARNMGNGRDVELWIGARKVASLKGGFPVSGRPA